MKIRYALVNPDKIKHRIVKNPSYGGTCAGLNGWRLTPVTQARYKKGFFEQLRESVRQEGFRNPILAYNLNSGLHLSFGCSRLRVAQEMGVLIPAIIMDHTDEFQVDKEVTTENWKEFFTDIPDYAEFADDGFEYHYSLERNRRETFDKKGMAWTEPDYIDAAFIDKEFYWCKEDYDGA